MPARKLSFRFVETAYDISAFSADVLGLLDHFHIHDPVTIIGHSMGGKVTQHFCVTYPERVNRAVLVATWAGPRAAKSALGQSGDDQLHELRTRGMSKYIDAYAHLWFAPNVTSDFVRRHVTNAHNVPTPAAINMLKHTASVDLRDGLSSLKVPTLVMVSGSDQRIPLEDSAYINRHLDDSWLRILPGLGHMPQLEAPNPFNQALLNFFTMTKGS